MVIVVIGLVGLAFGSFVNALVWRLREQSVKPRAKKSKNLIAHRSLLTAQDLSIVKGRSMCPNCYNSLAAKDLVPVLSWLSLKGRCRYCNKSISWQYPAVELITSLIFLISHLCRRSTVAEVELGHFCVSL